MTIDVPVGVSINTFSVHSYLSIYRLADFLIRTMLGMPVTITVDVERRERLNSMS